MQDQSPEQTEEEEEKQGGGLNVELLRSYARFAVNGLKQRLLLIALLFACGLMLTFVANKYLPRTYNCTTVLMTVANAVLDSDRGPRPLAGAHGLIMRHENLEALIKEIGLKQKWHARRPALLALKDRLIEAAFGPYDDKVMTAILVGTLETKVGVDVADDTLTISVDWTDPKTAAEVAEAVKESFLRARHKSEISAFQEKMGILDSHASTLRKEIDGLAEQLAASVAAKQAASKAALGKAGTSDTKPSAPRVVSVSKRPAPDDELPELRSRLTELKQKLGAAENDRKARMREEQSKLDELKLKFTPSHPQVITQEERLGMVSHVPAELAVLRSEVADLESRVRQREAMAKTSKPAAGDQVLAAGATPASAPLPTEILGLIDNEDADPALAAQMAGAVVRFGSLRDDVRGAKLALDTAQAAFTHRYQVVIPVSEPDKPVKPKMMMIFGVGFAVSLFIALLVPILLELRRDVVVEPWQVHHLQLPVLADLRLPEHKE